MGCQKIQKSAGRHAEQKGQPQSLSGGCNNVSMPFCSKMLGDNYHYAVQDTGDEHLDRNPDSCTYGNASLKDSAEHAGHDSIGHSGGEIGILRDKYGSCKQEHRTEMAAESLG